MANLELVMLFETMRERLNTWIDVAISKCEKGQTVFLISILLLSLSLLLACNKERAPDCLQQAGKYETEVRTIASFDRIELHDYIQIELYDSTETFVEITAPRNLIPEIITDVKDGKLLVENKNTCNFVRSYKNKITVRIYAPCFGTIENYGTGNISCINTIACSYFMIENQHAAGIIALALNVDSVAILSHTGVSDVVCIGQSTKTTLFNQGYGYIDARNLTSTDTFVNNSSLNDVYANCNGYLFAYIKYSGNIYYNGTPTFIDKEIKGTGALLHLD